MSNSVPRGYGKHPVSFRQGTFLWHVWNDHIFIAGDTTKGVCKMYDVTWDMQHPYNNCGNAHFEEFIVKPEILILIL